MLRFRTEKKEKKKKLPLGITDEFVAECNSSDSSTLKALIVNIQSQAEEARTFLKEDEKILELKSQYDEAAAPTRETIRVLKNRTKFLIDALKEQGQL